MHLLATRHPHWHSQAEAALLAEGIPIRWDAGDHAGVWFLDVPVSEVERAAQVLSEQAAEDWRRFEQQPAKAPPLLLQPTFAMALGLAGLLLTFHAYVESGHSAWFEVGALSTARALGGEWWRLVTAATLHADWRHALGNAAFTLALGWAAFERLGNGVGLLAFLCTALLGFGASLAFGEASLTVGASGGLFGLLGAAAGHAWRWHGARVLPRVARLRALGAGVLFLAFTAFSDKANVAAHVGGFASGLLLGAVSSRRPAGPWVQVIASVGVALVLVGAWWRAGARL